MINNRTIRVNTARWKAISKHTYCNQPTDTMLMMVLDTVDELNRHAKHPDFPISKSTFYRIKASLIRWCIMQARLGKERISYNIKDFEVRDGSKFVSIDITLTNLPSTREYSFHQPFVSPLRWVIWDEVDQDNPVPFQNGTEVPATFTKEHCIQMWQALLWILESTNWFIFDDLDAVSWLRTIQALYGNAFRWKGSGCFKLSTALNGGPNIKFQNGYVCKAGFFRYNFLEAAVEGDILKKIDLKLK